MIKRPALSPSALNALVALFLATLANLPSHLLILQQGVATHFGYVVALTLLLWAAYTIILQFISGWFWQKTLLIVLILLSSSLVFAYLNFGTIASEEVVLSLLETNKAESSAYLSPSFLFWFLATGVAPALFVSWVQIKKPNKVAQVLKQRAAWFFSALALIVVIAAVAYKPISGFGREHHQIRSMLTPNQFIYSSYKIVRDQVKTPPTYTQYGLDASHQSSTKPAVLVIMLGETARAQNYNYYGYQRDTNPFTRELGATALGPLISCGTATAISLPCMFSVQNKSSYNRKMAPFEDNVFNILQRAGVEVSWIDNDSGDKGVSRTANYHVIDPKQHPDYCSIDGTCYDEVMLKPLNEKLQHIESDSVIVLHLIGSHGPTYSQRYPKEFSVFTPECTTADFSGCSSQQITNSYDNTIHYTDFVVSKAIDQLQTHPELNTSLIYVSDHGESLGEKGVYLHGLPYAVAPKEQTRVPLLLWASGPHSNYINCLTQTKLSSLSHDHLFDLILDLAETKTKAATVKPTLAPNCSYELSNHATS